MEARRGLGREAFTTYDEARKLVDEVEAEKPDTEYQVSSGGRGKKGGTSEKARKAGVDRSTYRKAKKQVQAAQRTRAEKANRKRGEKAAERRQPDGKLGKKTSPASQEAALEIAPATRERDVLASAAGVSKATAERVLTVQKKSPELFEKVARRAFRDSNPPRPAPLRTGPESDP